MNSMHYMIIPPQRTSLNLHNLIRVAKLETLVEGVAVCQPDSALLLLLLHVALLLPPHRVHRHGQVVAARALWAIENIYPQL